MRLLCLHDGALPVGYCEITGTTMEKIEIQASNIKCAGCVTSVENGLKTVDGIENVSVDIPSNIVSIEGTHLNKDAIEARLAELGYPAV